MVCRRIWIGWLSLVAGVFWAGTARAATPDLALQQRAAARVPVHALPDQLRERVRQVLDEPTLFAHGPAEAFSGKPDFYTWLLDHPDRGVVAWRRLGARCQPVTPRGDRLLKAPLPGLADKNHVGIGVRFGRCVWRHVEVPLGPGRKH